jgi:hypothetical protein
MMRKPLSAAKLTLAASALMAGMAMGLAGTASAHRVAGSAVRQAAAAHGVQVVLVPRSSFTGVVVKCSRLSLHEFRCNVGFETPATDHKRAVACRERLVAFVTSHTDRKVKLKTSALCRPTPDPTPAIDPVPANTPVFVPANAGDYASQCVPALQFGNTGNFEFPPGPPAAETVGCESRVQQSSAASG